MTKRTTLVEPLCIPEKTLATHAAVLGKTGKGKSSVLRHIVEHLLAAGKRVCIVDPKGDWYGIKLSADGAAPGFPVIGFGDFKDSRGTDVPINAASGKHLAELITSGNRPAVIGFHGWKVSAMTQFWIEFAEALFSANSGELYLVVDEAHNFAPKGKILSPAAGECLHWSNRIMSEGRGLGLICLIASQRPQKVHNDTLTCCETLIALGVNHPADRAAIKDWIDGCGDKVKGDLVLNSLAGLQRGVGFVWSPEIGFGPERVAFPLFRTFDSFAPPQFQGKIAEAGWAGVDLSAVKEKLASVIEEVKANDPVELKKQLAALRRATAPAAQTEVQEVPVLTEADRGRLNDLIGSIAGIRGELDPLAARIEGLHCEVQYFKNLLANSFSFKTPQQLAAPRNHGHGRTRTDTDGVNGAGRRVTFAPAGPAQPPRTDTDGHGLDGAQLKIIDTVAMLRRRGLVPDPEMIARWLDLHPRGGRYTSNLAHLRREGFLDGCELTEKGQAAARHLATGLEQARVPLDEPQRKIIDALAESKDVHTTESLAKVLGLHPRGGRFTSNLARLRVMGLVPDRGAICLTEAAFA